VTPKHRLAGSYYWQQPTPPQTKPDPKSLTPKHRLTGSYYWQQTPPPQTKPDPKPEPKPAAKPNAKVTAATLAGKWSVNVETSNGPMESALELKADPKDAKKLAGTIVSQMGEAPIEGEFAEGKLTLWLTMNANGSEMSVTFTGEVQKDGSLSGTLDFGQGAIPWTAVRVKASGG
jgi:hypothetical protein